LMYFCSRKNQDAVSFLLSSGTPPTDEALKTAIEKGHSDITRLLIQYGASKDRGGEFLTAVSKNFNARQICNILAALDAAPIKKIEPQTAPPSPDEVVIESQLAGQSRREIYDFKRQERWTFFGKGVPPLCEKFNQLGHKDEGLKAAIAKHNKLGGKYTVDSILCPYKEITVSRLGRVPGGF
jgi:hypothetical protein